MSEITASVRLALNFPRVFVVGYSSFFEYTVHSASDRPMFNLVLTLHCPLIGLVDHVIKLGALAAYESKHGHINITPSMAGSQPIRCHMVATQGRDSLCCVGACRDFEVYEKPDSPANVSVIVQDIQSHRSGGDKGEFGSVKGDVNIHITDLLPSVKTVNELLQLRLPDSFLPVHLNAISTPEAGDVLSIPEVFLRYFEPTDVLQLVPTDAGEDGDSTRGWRLCSSSAALALGRSTQDADLVTRFLPASTENNARSALLSRKHALLRIKGTGPELLVESLAAHSAVRVGSQALRPGVLTLVPDGEVLGIGQALSDIRLRCTVRKPHMPRSFRVSNLSDWIGSRVTESMVEEGDWGRVELEPLNSSPAFWRTIWFHRCISFGSGNGVVLHLDVPTFNDTPGYIHHLRGCFWLECSNAGEGRLSVEGLPLAGGDIVPLRDGMKLDLGGAALTVKRIR